MTTQQKIQPMQLESEKSQMQMLAETTLTLAQQGGATSASVRIGRSQGVSIEVRNGTVDTLEFNKDSGVSVTVYMGEQKGSASTSDCSEIGLKSTVDAALAIAKFTGKDPYAGLAEPELYPTSFADLDLTHPWELSIEQFIELAKAAESAGLILDKRIVNSDGASVSTHQSIQLHGNSLGLMGFSQGTRHSIHTVLIAEDQHGMERDYYYSSSRNPLNLISAEEIGKKAAQRALARLNPGQAKQGYFPVLFSPEVARGLIGNYLSAISGGALYRKTSFLLDSMGQQIFPEWLNISENPHLKQGLASAIFDGDGVATNPKLFVEQGNVSSYLLSCYSARKLKTQTTGNSGGAFNVEVFGPRHEFSQLLAQIYNGLMVTEVMGQGVNLVTGDYSRGASGFWIENGQIAFPVRGLTIAGNLKEIFKGIQALGNDLDNRSSVLTGSILVDKMTVGCQ